MFLRVLWGQCANSRWGISLRIGRGEGEDYESQFVGFVERIVVSYGLADIFPGSGEAVLVENDNRRVKRRPLIRELKVEGCKLQVGEEGCQPIKKLVGFGRI
jgi:hypothetical protein